MTDPRPDFRAVIMRSRWRKQRWYVRLVWISNGKTAMTSETYVARADALNLARKLRAGANVEG